jgi:hypothetical protein
MHGSQKFWIVFVAVVAAIGVAFVLITPAPDELPSTGPHSLEKFVPLVAFHFSHSSFEPLRGLKLYYFLATLLTRNNLRSFTCVLLC